MIIKNRNFIAISFIFLCVLGFLSFRKQSFSLYPNLQRPVIEMIVTHETDHQEFYESWGRQIDQNIRALDRVSQHRSQFSKQKVNYLIEFEWFSDYAKALNDVRALASQLQAQLPRHYPPVRARIYDPGSESYALIIGENLDPKAVKSSLSPHLGAIKGTADYWISDNYNSEIVLQIDSLRLAKYGIALGEVIGKIKNERYNQLLTVSPAYDGKNIQIYFPAQSDRVETLKNLVLGSHADRSVRLTDIAEVTLRSQQANRVLKFNDQDAVAIAVWPTPDADLYQVANDFNHIMQQYGQNFGRIVILNNPALFIQDSLSQIIEAAVIGTFVTLVLILLFFGISVSSFSIAITVPVSLVSSFLLMDLFHVSMNLLSLGAIAITVGMGVDGSIIIIEALEKIYAETGSKSRAIQATLKEYSGVVIASNLTAMVIFVPFLFTEPMMKSLLTDLSIVAMALLSMSTVTSLLLVPALFSFKQKPSLKKKANLPDIWIEHMEKAVKLAVLKVLRLAPRRRIALVYLLVLLVISGAGSWLIFEYSKKELVAQPYADIIDLSVDFVDETLSMEQKNQLVQAVRSVVDKEFGPQLKFIYIDLRETKAFLSLHLKNYRSFQGVFDRILNIVPKSDTYKVSAEPWITSSLSMKNPATLKITALNRTDAEKRAMQDVLAELLSEHSNVQTVKKFPENTLVKSNHLQWLETRIIDNESIKENIRQLVSFSGKEKTIIQASDSTPSVKLKVMGKAADHDGFVPFGNLPIPVKGAILPLRTFVESKESESWTDYHYENGIPVFELEIWLKDTGKAQRQAIVQLLENSLRARNMDPKLMAIKDLNVEMDQVFVAFRTCFILAVFLIFLCLLPVFPRIAYPLIVLLSIPVTIFSGSLTILLFKVPISLYSMLGIVILIGVAINNSILITDGFVREHGNDSLENLAQSVASRVKPIVITSATTIVGSLPLALGLGRAGKILQPLGLTLTVGFCLATLLTIFTVPIGVRLLLPDLGEAGPKEI